jgi:DNA-binding IclR family transcriptional regulator
MAFLPSDELEYLLKTKAFARHNSRTIISTSALRRELMLVRKAGYALDDEEDEPGVCCIGAPVFNETRRRWQQSAWQGRQARLESIVFQPWHGR